MFKALHSYFTSFAAYFTKNEQNNEPLLIQKNILKTIDVMLYIFSHHRYCRRIRPLSSTHSSTPTTRKRQNRSLRPDRPHPLPSINIITMVCFILFINYCILSNYARGKPLQLGRENNRDVKTMGAYTILSKVSVI